LELKIVGEKEEKLLERKQVVADLSYEGATPSRLEVRKKLAGALKADENVLVIKGVRNIFGTMTAKVFAHLYKTKEDMLKNESPVLIRRSQPKKKGGEAEEKEPAEKVEKPKAEKTEKKEEKKE